MEMVAKESAPYPDNPATGGDHKSPPVFVAPRRKHMTTIYTTLLVLIALLALAWFVWFLIEFIRYVVSGEYEIDIRLNHFKR